MLPDRMSESSLAPCLLSGGDFNGQHHLTDTVAFEQKSQQFIWKPAAQFSSTGANLQTWPSYDKDKTKVVFLPMVASNTT